MRKVVLKMDEKRKYEVIKRLVETGGNKTRAAVRLGCSRSSVYRMIDGYRARGKEFFVHGNAGRKPAHARDKEEREKIVSLYNTKYWDANYAFFSELLREVEGINASPGLVRRILMDEGVLSPLATKRVRRELAKEFETALGKARGRKERREIECRIVAVEDAHAHRPRRAYFGELIQMDASIHPWFGEGKTSLHAAVDDATGIIVGAFFDKEETLRGYYNTLRQILTGRGIPYRLLTDRRTVFEYRSSVDRRVENDTFTQFSYALKQLGIDIKTSSVPQAKGRVERAFGTLQRRLPILLRMAGVASIEQANAFLNRYIEEYNARFALNPDNIPTVFEKQPEKKKIDLILSVITPRVVDAGHAIKFKNALYMPTSSKGNPVHFRKGSRGLVIEAFDGGLFFSLHDKIYALDAIPAREEKSSEIDGVPRVKAKGKRYVPPMNHPWRLASFDSHVKRQAHTDADDNDPQGA
jgi:transposase